MEAVANRKNIMSTYINNSNKILVENKKLFILKGSDISRINASKNNTKNNTVNISYGSNNIVRTS